MTLNLSETKRNILGVFILLLVNVIWVLSSELTNFIFKEEHYNKPFLSTYLKSSMFTLFLFGFVFSFKWRMLACPQFYYSQTLSTEHPSDEIEVEKDILGDPIFVPINIDGSEDERPPKMEDDGYVFVDSTEIEDMGINQDVSKRTVKFNKYLEVRQLSEVYAEDSLAARMSYQASKRHKRRMMIRKIFEQGLFPATVVMKIALQFCFCWFIASFAYQMGLSSSLPAVVNIISSTSSLFTLILAGIFPSSEKDKFTVTKLLVVLFGMGGVIAVSFADSFEPVFEVKGIIWSFVGALGYAIYLVLLRRRVRNESQMSLLMFFGFVGFWTIICFWPGFFVLNWIKTEPFQLPNSTQIGSLLLNGFIGTVGAELLWLWGCFLTSSLTATLALGLSIPMSMCADYFIYKKVYHWILYVGGFPILISFIAISFLTSGEGNSPDPVGNFFRCIFYGRNRVTSQYERLQETSESDTEDQSVGDISGRPTDQTFGSPTLIRRDEINHSLANRLAQLFTGVNTVRVGDVTKLIGQKPDKVVPGVHGNSDINDDYNDRDVLLSNSDLSINSDIDEVSRINNDNIDKIL